MNEDYIILFNDDDHSAICAVLYENHEQAIVEQYTSDGGKKRDTAFYKAGNFFFVIFAHKQPNNPQQIANGPSAIIIYDQNLNRLVGISYVSKKGTKTYFNTPHSSNRLSIRATIFLSDVLMSV